MRIANEKRSIAVAVATVKHDSEQAMSAPHAVSQRLMVSGFVTVNVGKPFGLVWKTQDIRHARPAMQHARKQSLTSLAVAVSDVVIPIADA